MNITKVTYQKAFVVGPYLQEKIGVEIDINEPAGDRVEFALDMAKEIVEKWHKDNNPPLPDAAPTGYDVGTVYGPRVIEKEPEDRSIGLTPELLMSCEDLVTLQSFYLLVDKSSRVELKEAYNKRKSELVDKETKEILQATEAVAAKLKSQIKK